MHHEPCLVPKRSCCEKMAGVSQDADKAESELKAPISDQQIPQMANLHEVTQLDLLTLVSNRMILSTRFVPRHLPEMKTQDCRVKLILHEASNHHKHAFLTWHYLSASCPISMHLRKRLFHEP